MQYSFLTLALSVASAIAQSTPLAPDTGLAAGCQGQYQSCLTTAKTPDQCKCDLNSCLGNSNDRDRAACASLDAAASLTSATATEPSSTFPCNPAHQYPGGQYCTEISGSLTLATSTGSGGALTTAESTTERREGPKATTTASVSAPMYAPPTPPNGTVEAPTSGIVVATTAATTARNATASASASGNPTTGGSTGGASGNTVFGGVVVAVVVGAAAWMC